MVSDETVGVVPGDVEEEGRSDGRLLAGHDEGVQRYLREIGKVSLLTGRDEVEIGQRIEAALRDLLRALARVPMAMAALSALAERVRRGEVDVDGVLESPQALAGPAGPRRARSPSGAGGAGSAGCGIGPPAGPAGRTPSRGSRCVRRWWRRSRPTCAGSTPGSSPSRPALRTRPRRVATGAPWRSESACRSRGSAP